MNRRLILPDAIRRRIIEHALDERPLECVGLLAGRNDEVERVFPLVNEARSETRFFAAEGLFQPMRELRTAGLELLAIYHSHPNSPSIPSKRDREENYYPDAVHLIVSLMEDEPTMRGWLLDANETMEVELNTSRS